MSKGEKDAAESEPGGLSLAAKRLLGIVAYYAVSGLLIAVVWQFSPAARELLNRTLLRNLTSAEGGPLSRTTAADIASSDGATIAVLQGRSTLLVLAGAILVVLPVAWVYSLTRRRRGFEQSLVHILVLLPVAVAGMVVLIQNSVALAFSLAGIVAVLRFRNTIEDVKDGVYVFIAVTVGISAAVGALTVGVTTSIVFNACVLTLWWLDFARRPTSGIRGGWRRLARLPKVTPPRAPNGKRPAAPDAAGDEVFASAARAWRRQLQLTAEHGVAPTSERFNASLHVLTATPDASRLVLEDLLSARTKRWSLTGVMPGEAGTVKLKYRVLVRRSARAELIDAVRASPDTVGVELR